ncbi:hypothetical protein B0A49_11568 [Cryomyces minteri]|uniref:linoleate 8R-lipoxygenase n=1 Tax=Cryomyces minteri TaxID=331657 RepID=A0A4U0WK25_9PEZI|nr:hypothetical protein B0A49_11568 [Cryomyces minteri]
MAEPTDQSEPMGRIGAKKQEIQAAFTKLHSLYSQMMKPMPTDTGDGTYLADEAPQGVIADLDGIVRDADVMGIQDYGTLVKMAKDKFTGAAMDDKEYLMEGLIRVAAKLPMGDKVDTRITDTFITQLWDDLQHPPQSMLGEKYQYRQADGSYNSLIHPMLGAAHTPYARTAKPVLIRPPPPDPAVLFDSLMAREKPEPHPNRISSMLFYLASIIIHDLFRTDHDDFAMSNTSSYLDFSPLYGSDEKEQKTMRTFSDGKIKPDCFSETRLLNFPPGVGCLLIMFNRFHNYMVEQLALINENGQFTKPVKGAPPHPHVKTLEQYDEDLFQTGRLITCGLYVNIILIDYVRTILNLNKTDDNWQLNPRAVIPNGPPLGVGNQVSAEFNLVYRWHSAVSDRDDKWTQEAVKRMFLPEHIDPDTLPMSDLLKKLDEVQKKQEGQDPLERNFAGLKRNDRDRKFNDDDLVKILTDGIRDPANAFGARKVPTVMRSIEILGIRQARAWNVASLNEFRQRFGLKPHRKFTDINSDKTVAEQLMRLYDHPDNVELYPGLVVEEAKKPSIPGAGLTPGFTISRAVLSDATALVRGDRFYTIDFHPKKLTNFGYKEVDFDLAIDNGCVFYKLFLRAFPNHFQHNSVYPHYPLTVPDEMEKVLRTLKKVDKYNFDLPGRMGEPKMIFTYAAAKQIFLDPATFKVTWGKAMEYLMGPSGKNFMLAGDDPPNEESRDLMTTGLYPGGRESTKWKDEVKKYYEEITIELLKDHSYTLGGPNKTTINQVDIVRDVGNMAHVHFSAELFSLPLKTKKHPHGLFTEKELYLVMAAVFICIFFDVDPEHSFPLRQTAHEVTQVLGKVMEAEVSKIKAEGVFTALMQFIRPGGGALADYGAHMIKHLSKSGMDTRELVWGNLIGTAGGMVANQGQLLAQVLDYYFNEGAKHLNDMSETARKNTPEADDRMMHYFLEGCRLSGETGVFRRVDKETSIEDNGTTYNFKPNDTLVVNLKAVSRDSRKFPDPDNVHLDRPVDDYITFGAGAHQCLGMEMTRIALTTMLKTIFKLEKLRPAAGPQGKIRKVLKDFYPGDALPESWHFHAYLTENLDGYFPLPTTMKVNWDGELPTAGP